MKKILLVDDDQGILEALTITLEITGYKVATLSRGQLVLGKVKQFIPDLILLDLLLPDKDGSEITKSLKNQKNTKDIPVIILSAHPNAFSWTRDCGADDFIAKPFDINDLIAKIKKFLPD